MLCTVSHLKFTLLRMRISGYVERRNEVKHGNHSFLKAALIFIILFVMVFSTNMKTSLANETVLEDGVYSLDYVVLQAQNESASIANDYFDKPATLFVKDGEKYIRFTLNHSEWVKELQAPLGDSFIDVQVVNEDKAEDKRDVQFKVEQDLEELIELKMHIVIESMEPVYDHRYTARLDFDLDSLQENTDLTLDDLQYEDQSESASNDETKSDDAEKADEESSISNVIWIVVIAIVFLAIVILLFIKIRKKKE